MSNSLPAAPTPPPPSPTFMKCENKAISMAVINKKPFLEECLWALEYPELQKACFLARICADRPPVKCEFYNIASILQVGPTCGLTALSMLLGGIPPADQLLQEAQQKHFTNNGEMFSANNLYELICDNIPMINNNNNNDNNNFSQPNTINANGTEAKNPQKNKTTKHNNVIECQMHQGRLNCAKVRESLQQGACIFVPYDPDFNHSPCLKLGHKAHWSLIIGFLITDKNEFFVLARHGKAKNLAVWSLQSLSDSNSNLLEFAQPKGYPDCDFLLPPGGIGGDLGLRERAIIVKGLPHEIISIS
ncbi:actin maturation protease [Calliphora vicina]|uniref:actin maturation protease n=1 Tax=Calliphora vicina TaxID=7373 RepID=UPI00325AC0EF